MSEINVRESVEALRPLVRQAKATVALSNVLESLVGLEDHKVELTRRVEELKALVGQAEGKISYAEAEAIRICAEAKAQAKKVAKDAGDAASSALARADEEAANVVSEAKSAAESQKAENDVLRQTGVLLQNEVDKLTGQRDAIKAEIDSLKATASRVLG